MLLNSEKIYKLSIKELKEIVKKYFPYSYKSKLNKTQLFEIVRNNLDYINLEMLSSEVYKDMINKETVDMNNLNKDYYYNLGLAEHFNYLYIDHNHELKFDNIIFITKDNVYKIIRINKSKLYKAGFGTIGFEKNYFELATCGRRMSKCKIYYDKKIEFKLDIAQKILFIIGVVHDFDFWHDECIPDSNYYNSSSYSYKDVKEYILNKNSEEGKTFLKDCEGGF